MTPQRIAYIAAICLVFILVSQVLLVNDYFQTTRAGLVRESDAILQDAFRKDLNQRRKLFKHLVHEDDVIVPPPPTKENTKHFDGSKMTDYGGNFLGLIDLAINSTISDSVPVNLNDFNSIVETELKSRNISSEFVIALVNTKTGKVQKSKKTSQSSFLKIPSKLLPITFDRKESLQLVLVNPFGLIIKRMGLMLISSLLFSIICLLAFRFLLKILAGQKQLVSFKNEFLATIAHELKRPVASLSFNLDGLSIPAIIENPVQREVLIQKSMNATMELNATINMIVALAKMEEGLLVLNKEPINLKDLFEDLKAKFMSDSAKGVVIQTVCELEECTVKGDAQLLSQCFANLIDNAIKYSSKEVLIIISLQKAGKWIIVSIKDNGYGIAEEKMPVIFDKYTRANPDDIKINGYGIGLNYVKTIVEKHSGEVEVKSQLGEGSEFSVLLPE
ncbi:MAG: HAMP domain-containing sensor histidine kinase [Paludibacter sp.]